MSGDVVGNTRHHWRLTETGYDSQRPVQVEKDTYALRLQ